MKLPERIVIDDKICAGKPCIKGSRLTVDFILELLGNAWSYDQIISEYDIEEDDIYAVLQYAHEIIREEKTYGITPEV